MHLNTGSKRKSKKQLTMKDGVFSIYHSKEVNLIMKNLNLLILKLIKLPVIIMVICVSQKMNSYQLCKDHPFISVSVDYLHFLTYIALHRTVILIMTVMTHSTLLLSIILLIGWKHDGPLGSYFVIIMY